MLLDSLLQEVTQICIIYNPQICHNNVAVWFFVCFHCIATSGAGEYTFYINWCTQFFCLVKVLRSNWFSPTKIDGKGHLVFVHSTFWNNSKADNKFERICRIGFGLIKHVLWSSILIGHTCPGKGTLPMPNQAGKLSSERNGGVHLP